MKTGIYWQDPKYALKPGRDFIFDPSLVLYLPLHKLDGASFMSRDAYGHLCTVTGALWRPYGRYFDGSDDYISVTSPWSPTARFSFECWYQPDTGYGNHTAAKLVQKGYHELSISNTTGKVRFTVYNSTPTAYSALDDVALTVGELYHLLGTYDPTDNKVRLYRDGALVKVGDTFTGDLPDCSSFPFSIGGVALSNRQAKGLIGEVRIYNRALSPLEIQHNYLATKWRYQ